MATKKSAKPTTTVDMKALAAELGVPVKEGKVTSVRDRYYVTVGQVKKEVPVGEIIDPAQIKSLVGKQVSVITAGRNVVAISGLGWRPPIIVCYVPAPDIVKGIREDLRATVINGLASRKVITPALQERLLAGR
ncbi:MAG: hypothetical protein LAQ30_05020 [Acidobacteriia bacterium]|nr:hypothetical protein [Terriglobia bacterium]